MLPLQTNDVQAMPLQSESHSGHPPFYRGEVEPPTKFSKRGGLTGPQLLEEGCWERGGDFFQEGGQLQFSHKYKLKSEIFNDKKVYK